MSHLAVAYKQAAATEAEALYLRLEALGAGMWLVVLDHGCPFCLFQSPGVELQPQALALAKLIRSRFVKEPAFQRDLFGWLYVEGRVLQRYAERQPRINLDEVA